MVVVPSFSQEAFYSYLMYKSEHKEDITKDMLKTGGQGNAEMVNPLHPKGAFSVWIMY